MPIRPAPYTLRCPVCGWQKTFAPASDVLRSAPLAACPRCQAAPLERRPAAFADAPSAPFPELAPMADALKRLLGR
ncbi:MAG: hypothetical protein ACTTJV_09395 [Ottowia sp.]